MDVTALLSRGADDARKGAGARGEDLYCCRHSRRSSLSVEGNDRTRRAARWTADRRAGHRAEVERDAWRDAVARAGAWAARGIGARIDWHQRRGARAVADAGNRLGSRH